MAVNSVLAPFPTFFDAAGLALENGYIYIGAAGFEARSTPKASFFDVALTIPTGTASGAAIRTKGGFPINGSGAPAMFYADGDYSISICDRNGVLLYSALSMTLALNVGGAVGPVLGSDGNLGAVGIGFVNEPNTGFVRSGANIMQTAVGGVLVSQQTPAGTVFQQPVSGSGFSSGVLAVAQPVDPDLTAIAALGGTGIAVRTAADTWAQRQIVSADGSITISNPAGVAGNIDLSATQGWQLVSQFYTGTSVANVDTPAFESGYDYAIRTSWVRGATNPSTFLFRAFKAVAGAYTPTIQLKGSDSNYSTIWLEILAPMQTADQHRYRADLSVFSDNNTVDYAGVTTGETNYITVYGGVDDRISGLRFTRGSGNVSGGSMSLFRRPTRMT